MAIALADHIVVDAHLSTADREVLLALKLECENYGSPAHSESSFCILYLGLVASPVLNPF